MSTTTPRYLETFSQLPEEDRRTILKVGAAFRRVDIEKKLARSQSIVKELEEKYKTTITELEVDGLPEDANYEMHEDYILWHHWTEVAHKARHTLEILNMLIENKSE